MLLLLLDHENYTFVFGFREKLWVSNIAPGITPILGGGAGPARATPFLAHAQPRAHPDELEKIQNRSRDFEFFLVIFLIDP